MDEETVVVLGLERQDWGKPLECTGQSTEVRIRQLRNILSRKFLAHIRMVVSLKSDRGPTRQICHSSLKLWSSFPQLPLLSSSTITLLLCIRRYKTSEIDIDTYNNQNKPWEPEQKPPVLLYWALIGGQTWGARGEKANRTHCFAVGTTLSPLHTDWTHPTRAPLRDWMECVPARPWWLEFLSLSLLLLFFLATSRPKGGCVPVFWCSHLVWNEA